MPDLQAILADPIAFVRELSRHPLDAWQLADFRALAPGLQLVAGRPVTLGEPKLRAYLERPRGHSKTSDIAQAAVYLLTASHKQIRGVVAAGDSDQARLFRNAVQTLCVEFPWLGSLLDVGRNVITNKHTGSECAIISSDAATSYGLLVDFIVIDELTHWTEGQGEQLWHSLISTAAKKEHCLALAISNAGMNMGSGWQWNAREAARLDDRWYFSRLDGPQASWITAENLAEQRRFLPPAVFARLWGNAWTCGGDALPLADILACIDKEARPLGMYDDREIYITALDVGLKHDHTALVTLAVDQERQTRRLANCQSWAPPPGGQIDLDEIVLAIRQEHQDFRPAVILYDPWQAVHLAQILTRLGLPMLEFPMSGKNLDRCATVLLNAFTSRTLTLYDDKALIRDLTRLSIVQKSFGFKLEASRDATGHADRATALAIALVGANDVVGAWAPFVDDGLGSSLI